ncbi:MAG: 3-methyladenine DNA glycosylase 2, partial [Acidobacteriaceae bacterium]
RSERWRPWRGYAAQHLWSASHAGIKPRRKPSRATASRMPNAGQTMPTPSRLASSAGLATGGTL